MTIEPTISTLTAEAGKLWKDIARVDELMCQLISADGTTAGSNQKINLLNNWLDEATIRVHRIEDYLMTLTPHSLEDVLILAAVAASTAKSPRQEDNMRNLPRMLAEIVAALEGHLGKTVIDLGAGAFGQRNPTWQTEVDTIRELVAREQLPTATKAA